MLLEHCATVGMDDKNDRTPSHKAAENGGSRSCAYSGMGAEDENGRTPFYEAAKLCPKLDGSVEVMNMLTWHSARDVV